MAHHKSAIRQERRSLRRAAVNKQNKTALRSQVKKIRESIKDADKEGAVKLIPETYSVADKSVKKRTIHANKARPHQVQAQPPGRQDRPEAREVVPSLFLSRQYSKRNDSNTVRRSASVDLIRTSASVSASRSRPISAIDKPSTMEKNAASLCW